MYENIAHLGAHKEKGIGCSDHITSLSQYQMPGPGLAWKVEMKMTLFLEDS